MQDDWTPPSQPIDSNWKPPTTPTSVQPESVVNQTENTAGNEEPGILSKLFKFDPESFSGMMESAAHPKSLGDILQLVIPSSIPNLRGIFNFGSKAEKVLPEAEKIAAEIPKPEIPVARPIESIAAPIEAPKQLSMPDSFKPIESAQIPAETLNPQDKLLNALKEAKPLRKEQESLYTAERGRRISQAAKSPAEGEEWAKQYMGALSGEMPKVTPARTLLEQSDVDSLLSSIKSTSQLTDWERPRAITGLGKLLSGSGVPQTNELKALERVFGTDIATLAQSHMATVDKAGTIVSDLVNLPKSMVASIDVSAPFRQGLGMIHRPEFWTSMDDMFKSFGSEKFFQAMQEGIRQNSAFELGQETGLHLSDLTHISAREEQFMSQMSERGIPFGQAARKIGLGETAGKIGDVVQQSWAKTVGKGVRASDRAYVGFLNKLRSDSFDSLVKAATDAGLNPETNTHLTKQIAEYVNTATGRGSLGRLENSAVMLNNALFSPRFIASRIKMLNPGTYIQAEPFVRKQYLKSLFAIAGAGTLTATLGKLAGGEVENNPTSSDFRKVKFGNTRLDPFGGFQQYITLASRLISNQSTSSTSGKSYEYGSRFGLPTRADAVEQFGANKLAPVPKFAYDWLNQSKGRPFVVTDAIARSFVPMMVQDIYDLSKEDPSLIPGIPNPSAKNAALSGLAGMGMGLQTYGSR